jgi:hypothetical protein
VGKEKEQRTRVDNKTAGGGFAAQKKKKITRQSTEYLQPFDRQKKRAGI